ncbi:hypothetical protein [Micromonospora tulbaghiae]
MIGAVQIIALGYKQTELPKEIAHEINMLRSSDAVRLLDVYAINKATNRTMSEHGIEELKDWDGELIRGLLRSSGASRVLSTYTTDSSGFLVQGTPIPDLKVSVPEDTNVIILLIEHVWARSLESALREGSVFPLAAGWAGRDALQVAGLAMNETAD